MSQEIAERRFNLSEVTFYMFEKIMAANKFGLTIKDLIDELLLLSRSMRVMPYFGPGWTLNQVLDDYVKQGKLEYGTLTVGVKSISTWIRPTEKFKFVPNEALEKLIERSSTSNKNKITVRDQTLDNRTRDCIRRGIVGL